MEGILGEGGNLSQRAEGYPASRGEKEELVTQVLTMLQSPQIGADIEKLLSGASGDQVMQKIATFASQVAMKVVSEIEGQKGDISDQVELAVVAMVSEELVTLAQQYGLKPSEEMVANIVEIASSEYNRMMGKAKDSKRSGGM